MKADYANFNFDASAADIYTLNERALRLRGLTSRPDGNMHGDQDDGYTERDDARPNYGSTDARHATAQASCSRRAPPSPMYVNIHAHYFYILLWRLSLCAAYNLRPDAV